MKIKSLVFLCIAIPFVLCAQSEVDALRYSQITFGGTARYNSMGGAFSALGGDFSTLSTNPAGLGVFRKSEISMSPSFFIREAQTQYMGNNTGEVKYNFNFGNLGLVYHINGQEESKWKSFNFGIGFNRVNNFHTSTSATGVITNSLADVFTANAQEVEPASLNPFYELPAFRMYVIDTAFGSSYYNLFTGYKKDQVRLSKSTGSMRESNIAFGTNYNDRIYLGATIGISRINYSERIFYEESEIDSVPGFQSFSLDETINTQGSGLNFKAGMIFRATDWMRLGASIQTPTFYNLTDNYQTVVGAVFDNGKSDTAQSPIGSFNYELSTPSRVTVGAGFVIKDFGIISIDYEYLDYAHARLSSQPGDFRNENLAIDAKYQAAGNLRVGAEYRLKKASLRAGYAYYGSPYKSEMLNDGSRMSYSAGLGFRFEDFYVDFAYVLTSGREKSYFYNPGFVSAAWTKKVDSSLMATFGIKF